MTLGDLFALSLSGRRDAPALDGDRALTFGELDAEVGRLARVLASRGVGTGSRVCLYLRNSPALVAVCLAIVRLGAIVVPINMLYRGREMRTSSATPTPSRSSPTATTSRRSRRRGPSWRLDELVAAAADPPDAAAGIADRRRRAGRDHLHVGNHRRAEGRGADARQLRAPTRSRS